jgi:hypothetical protein
LNSLADRREVPIRIGKRGYRVQTELDDDTLRRVVGIVNEVGMAVGGNADQDKTLMLMCLQLAYYIDRISERLESLDKRLDSLKP